MTPFMCFRIRDLELWTQDYIGHRTHVATCPDQDALEWLVNCLVAFHNRNVLQWDDPDSRINL